VGTVGTVEAGLYVGRASSLVLRRSGEDAQPTKKHAADAMHLLEIRVKNGERTPGGPIG
jgi:hypothetical protein